MARIRPHFGKIIIYFNENNRFPYFDHFMQTAMSDWGNITFLDQAEMDWGSQDWRNVSTNEMLKHSNSDWVCSIEQDWFDKDWEKTLTAVEGAMSTADLIGWWQPAGKYIHPGFWYMKRESLEKTRKDFAAHDGYDHFGWISKDAQDMGMKITSLQDLGFNCEIEINADCFHLGGVNQNYLEGLKDEYPFHQPAQFMVYNEACRDAPVLQDPRFTELSLKIEEKLKGQYAFDPKWEKFFK